MGPFLFPMDLAALEFRLHPLGAIAGTIATIGAIALLVWVYRELRQAPVLVAYAVAGRSPGPIWIAPLCGAAVALGIGILMLAAAMQLWLCEPHRRVECQSLEMTLTSHAPAKREVDN